MRRQVLIILGLVSLLVPLRALAADPSSAPPTIKVSELDIEVTGLTPSADLLWYGLDRRPAGYYTAVRSSAELDVADAFGELTISPDEGVSPSSLWFVVDLHTGGASVGLPDGFEPDPLDVVGSPVSLPPGEAARVVVEASRATIIVARPGEGAWIRRLADGSAGDVDGQRDLQITAVMEEMDPIGDSPPPPRDPIAGDVIFIIQPDSFSYFHTTFESPGQ